MKKTARHFVIGLATVLVGAAAIIGLALVLARAVHARTDGIGGCAISRGPEGHITRSRATVAAFLKSRGLRHTPTCAEMHIAGYPGCHCQIDHRCPLACGGCDRLENLQLLCGKLLDAKEKTEVRRCKELCRGRLHDFSWGDPPWSFADRLAR